MRKAIIRKIKSRKGASLSIAMLLFMVCAVVGGIILAAATAAGGRVNELAEADKRYYNVTSAAQLLAEAISGKEITIEQTKTEEIWTDAAGTAVPEPSGVTGDDTVFPYELRVIEGPNVQEEKDADSFLAQEALALLFKGKDDDEERWQCSLNSCENGSEEFVLNSTRKFQMNLYDEGERGKTDPIPLGAAATCKGNIQEDGTLVISVSNTDEPKYTLKIYMKPNYSETQINQTLDSIPVSVGVGTASGETFFRTTIATTKSSTISWYLSSIEKQ